MKIAILGGSFDPLHNGHIAVAKKLIKLLGLDQVWLMPCYKHPFNKNLSSPKHRLKMAKLLEDKKIKVSDFEINRKKTSYTIDTLKSLSKEFPKDQFFWIAGSDQIKSFNKWKNWQDLLKKFNLIIVPRDGTLRAEKKIKELSKSKKIKKNIIIVKRKDFTPVFISSSKIRNRVKNNKPISNFVPKAVQRYIIQNKLYK